LEIAPPSIGMRITFALPERAVSGVISSLDVAIRTSHGREGHIAGLLELTVDEGGLVAGDSGCLVCESSTGRPVGSLVATLVDASSQYRTAFATPIAPALSSTGLRPLALGRRASESRAIVGILADLSITLELVLKSLTDVTSVSAG